MYKMLLVEDEPIVRLALKSIVDWKEYGFDEVLEASNGKRALEIIKTIGDIDIVITDINMPIMNGIELIEESRSLDIDTQFLVLSAYGDYPFVRSAFKLGINDYILKTEMDPDKILKMVLGALEGINKTREDKGLKLDKEELLRRLLSGDFDTDDLDKGELRLINRNYISCSMLIDNFRLVEKRYENNDLKELISSVKNAVNQVLNTVNNGEVLVISPEEYGIFLSFDDSCMDSLNYRVVDIINKIRYALKNFLNIEVTIGISGAKNEIKNIKSLLEEAQKNARLRFIYGKGENIFPENARELNSIKRNKNNNIAQRIVMEINKENGLIEAIDRLDEEKCLEEMKRIFTTNELFLGDSLEGMYVYYLEITLMIIQYVLKDEENNIETIIGDNINFYSEIRKFDTKGEIENWILELLKKIINSLRKIKQSENCEIKKAKEFIQKNYGEEVTLEMVSKAIGFSKAYFSKIFTEETGDNFIAYLTKIRIEKSKELLAKTDMKIYEVCEKVGYHNIEHFSRTFKKIVGVSPLQYKQGS